MDNFKSQPPVMFLGQDVSGDNLIDARGRWHLSYNRNPAGYGTDTTALVFDNRVYFILNGDHRKTWGNAENIAQAVDHFMAQHESINGMSEHRMALGLESDVFALMPTVTEVVGPALFTKMFNFFRRTDRERS